MFKRISFIILFLSLSGLLYAHERKTVSLSLPAKKCIRNTTGLPPSADDFITIDFNTNYYGFRSVTDEQDGFNPLSPVPYSFFKETVSGNLFVQKALSFFKNQSIHLLNCIWLI